MDNPYTPPQTTAKPVESQTLRLLNTLPIGLTILGLFAGFAVGSYQGFGPSKLLSTIGAYGAIAYFWGLAFVVFHGFYRRWLGEQKA